MAEVSRIHVTSAVVYIAGYECPVESIAVSFGEGDIPTASISLPASEELVRFGEEDRVPIAIFYLDQWYSDEGTPDAIEPTMRLLFDGEISGWSYTKTAGGDYISFSCVASVNMLRNIFANFLIGADTAAAKLSLASTSTEQGIVAGEFRTFPFILLNNGLFIGRQEPIERPFDFIANMLLALKIGGYPSKDAITEGGIYSSDFRSLINANEAQTRIGPGAYQSFLTDKISSVMGFFVMYNHRTKFDKRWIATPLEKFVNADDPTEYNNPNAYKAITDPRYAAIRQDILLRATQRALESLFGQGDSFLKILETYYSLNAYEILMLPTAPYVQVGVPGIVGAGTGTASLAGIPLQALTSGSLGEIRLGNFISKPIARFALPPECNIFFPSMVSNASFAEDYLAQVTRSVSGNPYFDIMTRQGTTPTNEKMAIAATSNGWPLDLYELIIADKGQEVSKLLLYPEEYFKGPVMNNVTMPAWYGFIREGAAHQDQANVKTRDKRNQKAANGEKVDDLVPLEKRLSQGDVTPDEAQEYGENANRQTVVTPAQQKELYLKYTRASHYENRFQFRGGAVDGAFNPYVVACFPFVYLDIGPAGMHITGQVTKVTHQISAVTGMSTSIQYTYGRTLKETYEIAIATLLDTVQRNLASYNGFHASAPIEPTVTVAKTLQQNEGAAAYYQQTFYQTPDGKQAHSANKSYVFRYEDYFSTIPFNAGGKETVALPTSKPLDVVAKGANVYEVSLELKRTNIDNLTDYNLALQRVSRPICSLDQYISFINGGSHETQTDNISGLPDTGMIPAEVYGVEVPIVIRNYIAADNAVDSKKLNHYIVPTKDAGNFKDLRRDWVSRIKSYREKIYGRKVQ